MSAVVVAVVVRRLLVASAEAGVLATLHLATRVMLVLGGPRLDGALSRQLARALAAVLAARARRALPLTARFFAHLLVLLV